MLKFVYWLELFVTQTCGPIKGHLLCLVIVYSYLLGSRTTAVLFDPRTDPFEGQTKLLLSEEPVYNCIVIYFHFFIVFSFTFSTHVFIRCFEYSRPSSLRIWMIRHSDVNIMWLIEPMKIRPSVNSLIAAIDRFCIYCIAFI